MLCDNGAAGARGERVDGGDALGARKRARAGELAKAALAGDVGGEPDAVGRVDPTTCATRASNDCQKRCRRVIQEKRARLN